MTNKGRLIVFSAPSGCGKGTISATTRSPRRNEVDGVNYYFLTKEDFEQKINNNEFLEYACYCDNYYGTLVSEVDDKLNAGINVILEIEVQGAMKIRKLRPDALFIFISPPSVDELRRRLKKRGTESADVVEKRVAQAEKELTFASEYDYNIVNAELENAISDFFAVIRAEQLKIQKN